MKPATLAGLADRRGRRLIFKGDRLDQLLAYLAREDSTYQGAAEMFNCAKSTVEKTVYRLRKEKAPAAKVKT